MNLGENQHAWQKVVVSAAIVIALFAVCALFWNSWKQSGLEQLKWVHTIPNAFSYVGTQRDGFLYIDEVQAKLICISETGEKKYWLDAPEYAFVLDNVLYCNKGNSISHYDDSGNILPDSNFPLSLSLWERLGSGLNVYRGENGKLGYINSGGEWIIHPSFSFAGPFLENKAYVERNDLIGLVDQHGSFEPLCIAGWGDDRGFHEGALLLRYSRLGQTRYTFIKENNTVLHFEFDCPIIDNYPYWNAREFSDGLAAIEINGRWGYINASGEAVIPPQYLNAYSFRDDVAVVQKLDGSFGLIDCVGNARSPFINVKGYQPLGEYQDGIFSVYRSESEKNLVNSEGQMLLKKDYSDISLDSQTSIWVIKDISMDQMQYYCLLPNHEQPVVGRIGQSYKNILILHGPHSDFLFQRMTGEKLGEYLHIGDFSDDVAFASDRQRGSGYINTYGDWIVEPCLKMASDAKDGIALVKTFDGLGGLIKVN